MGRKMSSRRYLGALRRRLFTSSPCSMKQKILPLLWKLKEHRFTVDNITFPITCVRGSLDYGNNEGIDRDGRYEAAMSNKFIDCLKKLKKDSVFIDVGGGIGYYSILASQILLPRNIHVFEPQIFEWTLFQLNNKKYCHGEIKVNRLYIGDKSKKDVITLDEYCLNNRVVPSIIKMDIEGGEYYAIDGMLKVLAKYSPILLIEFHERLLRENFGVDATQAKDAINKIKKTSYKIQYNGHHYFANTHEGTPQKEWADRPGNNVNYALFCSPV